MRLGTLPQTSIAIVSYDKPAQSDILQFAQTYNLAVNLTEIMIDGPACCDDEMTTDIEWALAMSNSFGWDLQTAHIYAYEDGDDSTSGLLDALEDALDDDKARVLSFSIGDPESSYGSFLDLGHAQYQ